MTAQTGSDTQQRILEAAGEVFALSGFRNGTVREICAKAGVNIAAVNYHFRDKAGLYIETLRHYRAIAFERYPMDEALDQSKPPEERLRGFITCLLSRILSEGKAAWMGKLLARELLEPTPALDVIFGETVRPTFGVLSSIVGTLIGPGADEERIKLCCAGIVSQCMFPYLAKPIIERLFEWQGFGSGRIEAIADHVTRSSLYVLKGFAAERGVTK